MVGYFTTFLTSDGYSNIRKFTKGGEIGSSGMVSIC